MRSDKRAREEEEEALRARVVGAVDPGTTHEVLRYTWWDKHEGSSRGSDNVFVSRKSALLYICKLNSDALSRFCKESGCAWEALFASHALAPNSAFELSAFIQLSEDELQEYADGVCNAFSRHKAPQGTIYRYAPRRSAVIEAEELLNVLRREGDAPREEHHERQALLLSDIAGFD